jgi:predicted permease
MRAERGLRAYRLLLRLLPRTFRDRNAAELERMFRDMREEWEEGRGGPGPRQWMSLVWDVGRAALGEWLSLFRDVLRSMTTTTVEDHMAALMGDIRFAVRQLLRQPVYGGTIVLLMTLGIAGNAAVFRVFNGLFLRPLPFENAERLVDIDETAPQWDLEFVNVAYPDFAAWRRDNRSFEAMSVYQGGGLNFSSEGAAERISFLATTHDMDETLGLQPHMGRFYTAEEDVPDGARVGLVTMDFWQQRFGGDPEVLGRTVQLNGEPLEIIGVLPEAARFVGEVEMWVPLQRGEDDQQGWGLQGIGLLRPGVSMEQALADLTSVHKGMIESRPVNEITSPVIHSLRERYLGDYRLGSGFLLGAVGIVLLIACANIAGLMFARSLAREGEMSVRLALGAPRSRIIRQLLTESVMLATVGAVAGTTVGYAASSMLVEAMSDQFPRWVTFDLDGRFVAFTLVVTMGAAVLFGLAPALQASGARLNLSSATRTTASGARRRLMSGLVTFEVALAAALLVVGGLSTLDVYRLGRVDPGFASEGVLSYSVQLPGIRYQDRDARLAFAEDYVARLQALPGVRGAAVASSLPLAGHWGWFFEAEGYERTEDEANPVVLNRIVSPGYFDAMGIGLAKGRLFDDFDGRERETHAVIVNETFVTTHLSHVDDPLGARIRTGGNADWLTVVGVAKDVKHYGVDEEMRPGVYQPWRQMPLSRFMVALATTGEAEALTAAARGVTAEIDPELPLFGVQSMTSRMDESLWARTATSGLIAIFSTVALLLAVAGIYGVISYSVGQRTQEISIRMAMGAESRQVLGQVVRQGMKLVSLGVLVGLGASVAGAGLFSSILVSQSATDPLVYASVTVMLLLVAGVANYLPARRAAALDPMKILRGE